MKGKNFDAVLNFNKTKDEIGYVNRKDATQADYDRIGFMSGLEVHQQLKTDHKLFCRCPAGIYQKEDEYDAELIRHMRPTLSELGEYDGTALMEFKTRKEIVYRISNNTACTYDVDDTPPFPLDPKALEIAIRISLLSKLNIVGEVHITRKQYLDGSIPTGFQRTAIIGVEGEIYLKNKTIRLIQLSLEEDSCREVSDIGHTRVYRTDRLGMPLIETVTYPDCVNPDEVKEACDYIRFLNRSTGMVRTGMGAGRQDVNVSCRDGSRVEIKGVAHTKWIPELTHNEAFRQWALLNVKRKLSEKYSNVSKWRPVIREIDPTKIGLKEIQSLNLDDKKILGINLPGFKGILSHFLQPGKTFADELIGRLKVIACLIPPFAWHSEMLDPGFSTESFAAAMDELKSGEEDAQIIIVTPAEDLETAVEVIEERSKMAFEGVPNETRKSFENGTTVFERVLPGADRMYPDTDSAPIPLKDGDIELLSKDLPDDIINSYQQLRLWNIPEDTYTYIFSRNLFPLLKKIILSLDIDPVFTGVFIGQKMKYVEGHFIPSDRFEYEQIYDLLKFLKDEAIHPELAEKMLPELYVHPKMDFESILANIGFKRKEKSEILSQLPLLFNKCPEKISGKPDKCRQWMMGELRNQALGNIPLKELYNKIVSIN